MAEPTRTEHILGGALVEASKSFTGLADAVLTKVAERGTTADVVEVVANYLDGYDALDDDNIALIHRAQATAGQPTEPTEADPLTAQLLAEWDDFDLFDYADDSEGFAALVALVEPMVERLRALVGGRSAAPTREQVTALVERRLGVLAGSLDAFTIDASGPNAGEVRSGLWSNAATELTDAVVALVSRPAAEPPTEPLFTWTTTFLGSRNDPVPDRSWVIGPAGGFALPVPPGTVLLVYRGVAAEPHEEHGDGE